MTDEHASDAKRHMKAYIGVDADSGLVHTVTTTAANEADAAQVTHLLHGNLASGAIWIMFSASTTTFVPSDCTHF